MIKLSAEYEYAPILAEIEDDRGVKRQHTRLDTRRERRRRLAVDEPVGLVVAAPHCR